MLFGSKKPDKSKPGTDTAIAGNGKAGQMNGVAAGPLGTVAPSPAPIAAATEPIDPARQEMMRRQAAASKLISASFGEIIAVLMRSPHYRSRPIADLQWLVVPAVLSNQFMLAEARSKESGFLAPVGVVLWAMVSDEVDQRLRNELDKPFKLEPKEWRSGTNPWLVDAVGPPQVVGGMLQRLQGQVLKDQAIRFRTQDKAGKTMLKMLKAAEPKAAPAA